MTRPLGDLAPLATGLDHPEGVAFAPDGQVYATGEAGQVYRVDPAGGGWRQVASTGGAGLGLAADAAGRLYVCDVGLRAVMRVDPDGTVAAYSHGPVGEPFATPNVPAFDRAGALYVSDSGAWGASSGRVVRIAPGGAAEVWSREASGFTNGLALAPDGAQLYVAESNPPAISRLAIRPDGSAGPREVVAELPRTVPDGLAFDAEGGLLIACYAPDRIYRLGPDGALAVLFDDWSRIVLNAPTNLAFAGPDLDLLVIASLGGRTLMGARIGLRGAPLAWPGP